MGVKPFRFAVQASSTASGAAWKETARAAEGLGYSTLHLPDHYVDAASNGGQMLAAIPALAMAAAVTDTLRVGARVLCIDYHHPAVLAKTAATLDFLSDGRFELGLGAGWVASEYEAMGIPMDSAGTRVARLRDTVTFLHRYFTGEPLDGPTGSIAAAGFRGQPASVQQPHPPILVGGGSPKVLHLAGELADIVSFNFDNRAGVVGPAGVQSSSASAMDAKVAWAREGAGDRFEQLELEVGAYFTVVTDQADATAEKMGSMFGMSAAEMLDHPNALIGPVEALCERLLARRERYGFSYVTVSDRAMEAFAPVVARLAGS
jgi:probable F420-dependent oxidoreductase